MSGVAFRTLSDGFVQFWRRTKWEEFFASGRTQEGFQGQLEVQLRQARVCRVPHPRLKDLSQAFQIPEAAHGGSSGVNPAWSLFDWSWRRGAGSWKCAG